MVEQTYVTERGRRRRRLVAVDLGVVRERLRAAGAADRAAWEQVRAIVREAVGESTFDIWLERLELIAVDRERTLIVSAPAETAGWIACRFARVLDDAAHRAGRPVRVADEVEGKAAESLAPAAAASAAPAALGAAALFGGPGGAAEPLVLSDDVVTDTPGATRDDRSTDVPTYTSAYPSSYSDVYNQAKEVS